MVVLHASLAIAVAFLGVEDATPATAEMKIYKSSMLGFSIQYPATWEKCRGKRSWCGTRRKGLTQNQRLRKPVSPVLISPSCKRLRMEGLQMTVFRKYDQALGSHVASLTPSVPGFQKVIVDFEFGAGRMGKKVSLGPESWTYVLLAEGRLFELAGLCWNNWEAVLLERTFDAMAKSLTLSASLGDQGAAGTFRRYEGAGLSFEYPADWTMSGYYDDDKNIGANGGQSFTVQVPVVASPSAPDVWAHLDYIEHPYQRGEHVTPEEFIATTKRQVAETYADSSFASDKYKSDGGHRGATFWYGAQLPNGVQISVVGFVFLGSEGGLHVLVGIYPISRGGELKPAFDRIGRSVVVR